MADSKVDRPEVRAGVIIPIHFNETMSFLVAQADLNEARDEVVAALKDTRKTEIPSARFDWMYYDNPDGPAVLWTIRDGPTGEMAGFTVALPRRVYVAGEIRRCWNCADFSIHTKFRTLGVAVKLRRAARDGVDAGDAEFLYAHPNARMQVVHERVGHTAVGTMVRYAKLIKSSGFLQRRLPAKWPVAVGSPIIDRALALASRERRHRFTCSVRFVEEPRFDERFDRLSEESSMVRRVVGVRDAAYLNWRYGDNPLHRARAVFAEEGPRLCGYALFTIDQGIAYIKDVFPPNDPAVVRDLVAQLIREARRLSVESISVVMLEGNPVLSILKEFGFSLRVECSKMFAYAPENSPLRPSVLDSREWFMTEGDRDV